MIEFNVGDIVKVKDSSFFGDGIKKGSIGIVATKKKAFCGYVLIIHFYHPSGYLISELLSSAFSSSISLATFDDLKMNHGGCLK